VVHPGNVRGPDGDRVAVYFLDKPEQGLFRVRDGRSGVVGDDRIDLGAVFQQFRRNCGVALDSKRTLIARRSECGNQFPLSGGQGRGPAHDLLREPCEVLADAGFVPEQMEDLRDHGPRGFHLLEQLRVGTRAGLVFNFGQ
jgi:hypothetical protein